MTTHEKIEEILSGYAHEYYEYEEYAHRNPPKPDMEKATQAILALINQARKEAVIEELEYMKTGQKTVTKYADNRFEEVVTYVFAASEIDDRIKALKEGK